MLTKRRAARLVEADRAEDAGQWEHAAWLRLTAWARGEWLRLPHGDTYLESTWVQAALGRETLVVWEAYGRGTWRWTKLRGWRPVPGSYGEPYPQWVRVAVEGTAAQAVALVLTECPRPGLDKNLG